MTLLSSRHVPEVLSYEQPQKVKDQSLCLFKSVICEGNIQTECDGEIQVCLFFGLSFQTLILKMILTELINTRERSIFRGDGRKQGRAIWQLCGITTCLSYNCSVLSVNACLPQYIWAEVSTSNAEQIFSLNAFWQFKNKTNGKKNQNKTWQYSGFVDLLSSNKIWTYNCGWALKHSPKCTVSYSCMTPE